ncbi:MAG: alanine--tRNA ligase [Firmicutes bacterium]|nr:alanine--tRNA ligase [Bacillota bacterium]
MKKYSVNELREMYLSFFESKDHLRMNSFSLVPQNDNSLLLINAGMAPLKPYFTGQEIPPRRRVTTCQKCIRTGDIENVGKTARHGTFFEMLGNFSFGDYFKHEAIAWTWEFLTDVVGLDPNRLYPSVYQEDDEAFDIWNKEIGVAADRIFRFGKEDNFWEHGAGPCGPCSEVYYDRGEKYGCGKPDCKVGCECDRFMEVWNNVFTQFNGDGEGGYVELDNKNIDTGMGLERLAVVVQDVDSMFDIDTIKAIRDSICKIAGVEYGTDAKKDISIRVITDHVRSVTFMTSDGVLPSNEGRGYVLRRLLRRAARHGRLLGINRQFLVEVADVVIQCSKEAYPELADKMEYINKVLTSEEEKFYQTLDGGLNILQGYMEEMKASGEKMLSGERVFKLYDTYGFPTDLTAEIVEEQGFTMDEEGFKKEMEAQRERARSARGETNYMGAKATIYNELDPSMVTTFDGYDRLWMMDAEILAMTGEGEMLYTAMPGTNVTIFTNKTPFYATMGGQEGDQGTIQTDTGLVQVDSTIKAIGDKIGHVGVVIDGMVTTGQKAKLVVSEVNRMATARNHSATHLLQKALRNVLGSHVEQAGSYVSADRLRFDFTHFQAMTPEELGRVEREVNRQVLAGMNIKTDVMTMEEARKSGAMALFGEKYGESVRVVSMGDYSKELCGGTHLKNTAQVGSFKIVSENGVAAGVRRIEALTGTGALEYYEKQEQELNQVAAVLKSKKDRLVESAESLMEQMKELQRELASLQSKLASGAADDILKAAEKVGEISVLTAYKPEMDANALRQLGDSLKDKLGECVILLAGGSDKLNFVAMATDGAVKAGAHAGNIIKEAAKTAGGGGGGRPNMAQAGGKDASKAEAALEAGKAVALSQLG